MTVTIRSESPPDIPGIHALIQAAFLEMPYAAHTEHLIVDALRDANALTLSLVAEDRGAVVGHVALSPVTVSDGAQGWYGLGPISVSPERHRQGIGSMLMLAAIRHLKEMDAAGCVLAGDPAYYGRFGFAHQGDLSFPALPAEFFLVNAFTQSVPRGVVAFHPAFDVKG